MVKREVVFSLLALSSSWQPHSAEFIHNEAVVPLKSIAIIYTGLAIVKTFLDLPEDIPRNWDVVLYERCRNVGGIW
jgi:hypothetical protein